MTSMAASCVAARLTVTHSHMTTCAVVSGIRSRRWWLPAAQSWASRRRRSGNQASHGRRSVPDILDALNREAGVVKSGDWPFFIFFYKHLYCLTWISLNSLVFTISWQLGNRKPKPRLLLTQGIFNLPHGMRATGLWGRCKLYTAVEIWIGRYAGMGNRTTNLQIRSQDLGKKGQTV